MHHHPDTRIKNRISWFSIIPYDLLPSDEQNVHVYNKPLSNLNFNNITGIIPFNKGGVGFNNISRGQLVYAINDNSLSNLSNIKWNNSISTLEINGNINLGLGNISGNGSLLTNINVANILGIVPVSKGGSGINVINEGRFLIGDVDNKFIEANNLIWNNIDSRMGIQTDSPVSTLHVKGTITCDELFIGEGENKTIIKSAGVSQISFTTDSITGGILKAQYGGTGIGYSSNQQNKFLIGKDNNSLQYTNNLIWTNENSRLGIGTDTPQKTVDIIGDININGTIYNNSIRVTAVTSFKENILNTNIIYTDKQLFIGYSNSDNYKLKVNGNMYVSGYITGLSDIRYKRNISNITNSLDKIDKLNGIYYNLLNDDKRTIGLIAQDVEEIIPEVVYTNTDDTKSIAYGNLVALLIESIKELKERIIKLEEKVSVQPAALVTIC